MVFHATDITNFLEKENVDYTIWPDALHHIPTLDYHHDEFIKANLVRIDKTCSIVVTKILQEIDLNDLRQFCHRGQVQELADDEIRLLFPGCDPTALPPLGAIFGLSVFCSEKILEKDTVCFNAGSHEHIIRMPTEDFIRINQPKIGSFSCYADHSNRYEFCL